MSNSAVFQTQLASVIDTMAKTAITEIMKLVDDYSAVIRWEMYRSQSENEELRKKLEATEKDRLMPRGLSTAGAGDGHPVGALTLIGDESRGADAIKVAEFGNEFADEYGAAGGDAELPYGGDPALHGSLLKEEPAVLAASELEMHIIKEEGPEEEFGSRDGRLETSGHRKWEEQGAVLCPTLPVARKQAPEQCCEEKWAGHYPPAEGPGEPPCPHRTGPSGDPLSGAQNPRTHGCCVPSVESLVSPGSEHRSDRATVCTSDAEADDLSFSYTLQQQGALQQYGPAREQTALNTGTAGPGQSAPGKTRRSEKQLSCTYCGKSFPYLSYLKRHLQNHTGERPHRCAQCGRCFTRRSHLVRHQQVHYGVKPFDCALCGRRFTRLSHLDRHLRTHV